MKLYTQKILKLTTEIPRIGRIDKADKIVSIRSPICGSSVTIYINKKKGEISDFKQEIRACALGQASASILASNIIGINYSKICELHKSVQDMLEKGSSPPPPPFSKYELLRPASEFKNRHASIMLPLNAAKEALKDS